MSTITLKGITWNHARGYDPLVAASALFLKQNGIEVQWQKRSLKDFGDQSLEQLAEQFDLLIIDHPHSGVAAQSNCVLPLDEYIPSNQLDELKAQSAGPSFASYHYQGHQWAIPIDAAFQSACYRPDLLKAAPPKSWGEVFALAESIKKEGKQIGMALCPTDALCSFLSLAAQLGSPVQEDSDTFINREIGVQALQLLKKMRDAFHPESFNWNPIQLYDEMAENDAIVYSPLAFNYTNYSRKGFRKNELIYTNPPGITALLGGAGLAVSNRTKHVAIAVDYAVWICGAEIQKGLYTENQGQPGNAEAWKSEPCNQLTHDFFKNTQAALDAAYVRPRFAKWPTFQEQLGDEVHRYLKEDLDEGQTLEQIAHLYWLAKA